MFETRNIRRNLSFKNVALSAGEIYYLILYYGKHMVHMILLERLQRAVPKGMASKPIIYLAIDLYAVLRVHLVRKLFLLTQTLISTI